MSIDAPLFRQALGSFASGIAVATCFDDSVPVGITISSLTSLSLSPPLVLFCLDKMAHSYSQFIHASTFSLHILAEHQQSLAQTFAGPTEKRWHNTHYEISTYNTPHIPDVLTTIDCTRTTSLDGGDHTIIIGQVEHMQTRIDLDPLLYYRGQYNFLKK